MRNWMKVSFLIMGVAVIMASCQSKPKKVENLAPNAHQVVAEEVISTSAYTYVRVSSEGKEYWLATDKMDIKKGTTYFWSKGMIMNDFVSKELKRTFPVIWFIEDFTDVPITVDGGNSPMGSKTPDLSAASRAGKQQAAEQENIVVTKAPGGITIAELYEKRDSYAGKEVKVRGQVVRFSKDIMKKNWVHLQDGSKFEQYYDLAITTGDTVKFGDVVIFKGKISVNRDFGAGYKYDAIMEDATIIQKN